jgi:YD repeat-containing protein
MRTYGRNSRFTPITGLSLGVAFMVLIATAAFAQSAAVEAFSAMGFQKNRNYFSPEPYEHYDTVSGNVLLTFTDLTLPGNAGRSLQFQRFYNNQRFGLPQGGLLPRWSFGIAGMVMHVVEANPVPINFDFNDDATEIAWMSPTFVMADNGRHPTMPVVEPNTSSQVQIDSTMRTVMSAEFHKYDRQTYTMYMADGTVAHYEANGTDPLTGRQRFSLVQFEDPFDNTVTLTYTADTLTVVQDLGNGQARTIEFLKVGDRITRMTFDGRMWQYTYDVQPGNVMELVSVTLPIEGVGWTFDYDVDLEEITTPNGGRIEYDWDDVLVEPVPGDMSQNFTRHFLHFRKSKDRNGTLLGTWALTWGNQFDDPTSFGAMIELPSGVKVGFGNGPLTATPGRLFTGGFGLAQRLLFDVAGQLVESESLSFVAVPVIRYSSSLWWGTPELSQRTVTRGTRAYSTQWSYNTSVASAASFPWNTHNPTSIIENNNEGLGRTTNRTYVHRPAAPSATTLAPYVLGLPETESVTISTETYSRSWQYNTSGFTQQYIGFGRTGASGIVRTFTPDSRGNVATASTATSSTSYLYTWGVASQVATAEHTTSRVINIDGTIASETKGGRTTTFVYDDLGRPTVVTPPGGTNPTTTDYALDGTTITTTRGTSSLTSSLDAFGRPTGTLDSQGVRTTIRYDEEGRVKFRSLPFYGSAEVGTTITYDALDRVKEERNSDNSHREYVYGPDTTTIVDEEARTTVHRFVAFGHPDDARLTIVTDAQQQPWTYAYDVLGRIRSVTASDGISRTWEYNDQGLLFRETHPESGVTTYQYNAGGLLTQKTDAKGQTFVYAYDANDRVQTITVGSELTVFTYEAGSDNRKSMDVDGVHTEFGYDTAGRRASRVDVVDGFKFTTTFGYDNNDNLTSISYPSFGSSGNRRQIGYEYDSERRLTRVRDLLVSRDFATSFSHHASGALLGYTAGNGVPSTFTYHPTRYWMTSLSVGSHWSLQYSNYDDVGNVGALVDSRSGMNQDLVYDELDRLISVAAGPGLPPASWTYDIHGNRTNANGTTYTYYPGKLRLWTQNSDTYTYDNNGNLLTGTPGRTFTYTAWNRVASATMGGTTTNYRYDADDWRVKKSSGTTTTYLLRGLNGELLTEWKNPGTNGETRDYIYAGSRLVSAITRPWNETFDDWFGTIIPNGPEVAVNFTAANQRAFLTFDGVAGRRVSLKLTTTSGTLCLAWPMAILKPDGNPLASTYLCGSVFIDPVELPVSGTYTVFVDNATAAGVATLNLYDVVDISGTITPDGPAVTLPFSTPGQKTRLTFSGNAGQRVSVRVTTSPQSVCAAWPLAIHTLDDTTVGSPAWACGTTFLEPVALPTSEMYTVFIDPGDATVPTPSTATLYDVTPDVTGTLTINGAAMAVPIVDPGQNGVLTFAGTAGQQVTVRLTGNTIGYVPVRLFAPDGSFLTWDVSFATSFNLPTVTLSAPGTYTVTVNPYEITTGSINVAVTSP